VIVFDNRGVGASTATPATSMERMADDAITFIKGKGFRQVDLFGFSMGGMIAKANGIEAGKAFLARLMQRSQNRDKEIAVGAYLAQLQALSAWGQKQPANLSVVRQPILVVNGDDERMVPTPNSHDLARRLPNSTVIIYPDSGHGGVFQNHTDFVPKALEFLVR
jgi:pimeloyl-ACP methyl ester carboxylesterase